VIVIGYISSGWCPSSSESFALKAMLVDGSSLAPHDTAAGFADHLWLLFEPAERVIGVEVLKNRLMESDLNSYHKRWLNGYFAERVC